jgi:cytidylate kinase
MVFPDSPFKFYLDADPRERARRRLRQDLAEDVGLREALGAHAQGFRARLARIDVRALLTDTAAISDSPTR